jgi:hypothetical protein
MDLSPDRRYRNDLPPVEHDDVLEAAAAVLVIPALHAQALPRAVQDNAFLPPVFVARIAADPQHNGGRVAGAHQFAAAAVTVSRGLARGAQE